MNDVFMLELAALHGSASTCPKAKVGAVILRAGGTGMADMAYGWNGAPTGMATCRDQGCVVVPATEHAREHSRHLHAEARAIANAAAVGLPTENAMIYVTLPPCLDCAKLIIAARFWGIVIPQATPAWKESVGLFLEGSDVTVREVQI